MVTPIVSIKYRQLYQFCYSKIFSTNQNENLLLLEDPGRVRSQITNVVCQIQWFDFGCNLAVTRKVTHLSSRSIRGVLCHCKIENSATSDL